MNFLTIIPARGGSKGLKNKNILNFNGKPLIHWTLKAAKKSKYINDIIVSTDSKKIAKICEKNNCKINSLRPNNLSKSSTLMSDVIDYELEKIDIKKKKYDALILLQPTSPLRTHLDINKACELFIKNKSDSLVTVNKLKHICNPDSLFFIKKNLLKRVSKKKIVPIRQKKNTYYHANGAAIYITKMNKIKNFIIGGKMSYLLMKDKGSIDIDNHYDFKLAELIMKNYEKL
jgi:CMP-N,N'-diacetyllegionaminic acid synthase